MDSLEYAKRDLSPEEFNCILQTLQSDMYTNGVLKDVPIEKLQKYLANPDTYKKELERYSMYQYMSNGDIFQLYDLIKVLPNLNYRIKTLDPSSKNDNHILTIRRSLLEMDYKELTRDILSQVVTSGTLVGLWVGKEEPKSKNTPYLMIFDNLNYFFPARRVQGKWRVWCDLSYFNNESISTDKRYEILENLSPYVTLEDSNRYMTEGEKYRYIEFPVERSVVIRTHTLKRNQRFGIPWNTQAIYDIKHKEKLRNLEKVASNKVMNAVAVLTIGLKDKDQLDRSYLKLPEKLVKNTFKSVKEGLMSNEEGEASVVGLPEWADLKYPDQKTDVLDPDKIETINEDISSSLGMAKALSNGTGGNYASAKLNLDIIYSRIGQLLESIESEVFNKMIKILLPKNKGKDYFIEFEKTSPLTNKEKSDILFKLHSLGYSLEPLIQMLGIDFTDYVKSSKYEIEDLKLRDIIHPPMSSYTMSDGESGRKEEDTENTNSNNTKENDGNNIPDANV